MKNELYKICVSKLRSLDEMMGGGRGWTNCSKTNKMGYGIKWEGDGTLDLKAWKKFDISRNDRSIDFKSSFF